MFTKDERLRFAYTFMKFNEKDLRLDFWQDAYIKSMSRFAILVKSRRTGFSFVTALKGIVKSQDPDRVAYTKQFVSYNESDALEKINYAAQFYNSMPGNAKKKCIVNNKSELDFLDRNGKTISRLISIPCRPPRGKGGDICLDEFHIYQPKMSDAVYTAALPVISRGGCIEMGSTPLGKLGKFYEIYTDKKNYPSYERYNIPWWFSSGLCKDVVNAIKIAPEMTTEERVTMFGTDILIEIFRSLEIEQFQQEYECKFIDSEESYISLELIYGNTPGRDMDEKLIELSKDKNITDEEYWQYNRDADFLAYSDPDEAILHYNPEKHGKPLYFGYDVGRFNDRIAMFLIGDFNGKKRDFMRIELKNATFETQQNIVKKLYSNLPIFRGYMDRTGIGQETYERLHKDLGDRILGVEFNQMIKEVMATSVKRGLENHEYMLSNDKDFHTQIHSIKRLPAVGKYFRYDAARNEKGHADSFWAWALASYAMDGSQRNVNFYEQWAQRKNAELNISTKSPAESLPQNQAENGIRRRGKSVASVMNAMRRRYRS